MNIALTKLKQGGSPWCSVYPDSPAGSITSVWWITEESFRKPTLLKRIRRFLQARIGKLFYGKWLRALESELYQEVTVRLFKEVYGDKVINAFIAVTNDYKVFISGDGSTWAAAEQLK